MKKIYYKNHLIQNRWSQVFLKDQNVIDTIIKEINPQKNQIIIEIGPGLGALTTQILNITDSLILIERDTNLVHYLLKIFHNKNIKILNQDVLTVNFFSLLNHSKQKLRLIGNLPYNISTKLITYLFKYIHIIHDMHFMVQKEVGDRLLAHPNTKAYGRLSIITQYHCEVIPILKVSPTAFIPIPQVKSTIIRLLPHTHSPYPTINVNQLSLLTKFIFNQRRKIIKHSLSTLFDMQEIKQQNIKLTLRPENLTIHQYCILVTKLNNKLFINKKF